MSGEDARRELQRRTRRGFLGLGAGAVAGVGLFSFLRSRPAEGGTPGPFRSVLQFNESAARRLYSPDHRAREFPVGAAVEDLRENGDIGLDEEIDVGAWTLALKGPNGSSRVLTLDELRKLPRVEQVTELNCIEGWTEVVHWGGVRFSEFTAAYAPQSRDVPYVALSTPDDGYFVGLDAASAMHPQTLLCYEMNGRPLTAGHGAPLRLVIPVKYGIKNIKRIGTIRYSRERPEDYWASRGYDWYAGL